MKNKTKFLLALSLIAMLTVLFAISVSAADPVETWDISATSSDSVTAYLFTDLENEGMYTLTISGTGNMKNWTSYPSAPWRSSYSSKITSVTIEEGVTSIGDYAFCWCKSLTSIVIHEGVTSIGNYAFYYCYSLTSIVIPDGVTSIGNLAFYGCSNLIDITVNAGNTNYKSIDGNLYSYDGKTLVQYAVGKSNEAFTIPEAVTSIGSGAFHDCFNLTSIVIPDSVTSIGNYAFQYCSSLTSIVIPEGVTSVGNNAFNGCSKLTIYAEAKSQPSGWNSNWNYSNCPVVWGHTHNATSDVVNNTNGTHTGKCECGNSVIENHIFGAWAELDETTKVRECICGEKDYLVVEKEDDKVNVKPSKPDKDKNKDKVKIDIVFNEDVFNEIGIEIIPEILEQINGMETEIGTDLGTVILDAIASSKVAGTEGSVNICVADITTDKEEKTGHKVFSITVNDENGNPILPPEKDDNGTVTLSLKYQKGLIKEQIKIAYRDENGKLEHMEVEKYDPETGEVTFKTNHLSDYVIYHEELTPEVCLESIFTFKGYSFGWTGSMAVGFDIDYEAIRLYEELTGETLDFGVVFAGFDALGGNMPLDANGNAHADVVKFSTKGYDYIQYDFVITDMTEEYFDISFVISAYICNGAMTKFVQANGLSDTVTGITYNEAKGA